MLGGNVKPHRRRRCGVHIGVGTFKYLGRILDWSDDDWSAVLRNIGKACRFWKQLGKLLRREGMEPRVSVMFY